MSVDTNKTSSRRSILTGAAVGVGALAAGALGRPPRALANDGDPVLQGVFNTPQSTTTVAINANNSLNALVGAANNTGTGVVGSSPGGNGVHGTGGTNGVSGTTANPAASGVFGENTTSGFGVAGRANAGTGVLADSLNGTALDVQGVASFSRSGKLTIAAGTSSVTMSGIRIDPSTLVLATLQQDRPGVHVRSADPNPAADSFTIRLNKPVGSNTKVAWFLVN